MKVWACLLVFLQCSSASAQAVSDKEKRTVYNLFTISLAVELCAEDYVFDEGVLRSFVRMSHLDATQEKYKPVLTEAGSDAQTAIDTIGLKKYCEIIYSQFGGEHYANLMQRK